MLIFAYKICNYDICINNPLAVDNLIKKSLEKDPDLTPYIQPYVPVMVTPFGKGGNPKRLCGCKEVEKLMVKDSSGLRRWKKREETEA